MSTPHFHVYGRTRPPARNLHTLGTFHTRTAALADMRQFREDLRNGIDFKGCVSFTVSKYACNCPMPSYLFGDSAPTYNVADDF